MRIPFLIIAFHVTTACLAQKKFMPNPDSVVAQHDIANKQIFLYCGGGWLVKAPTESDTQFEKTYGLTYQLLGCVMPSPEDLRSYNRVVAIYLDQKYDTSWRKTVRTDVWGITK